MAAFLIPFDAANLFGGLHESLYADHHSVSTFLVVTGASFWNHLWDYPEEIARIRSFGDTLYASCLQLVVPFLVPVLLWFGLERFLEQSHNALRSIRHLVALERDKLPAAHDDIELQHCLQLMAKNRQEYEQLLRLCDQFPGQREKADLARLGRLGTTGSGDVTRLQGLADLSDSADTDWSRPADLRDRRDQEDERKATPVLEPDLDRAFPGYTDDEDDDEAGLRPPPWN